MFKLIRWQFIIFDDASWRNFETTVQQHVDTGWTVLSVTFLNVETASPIGGSLGKTTVIAVAAVQKLP